MSFLTGVNKSSSTQQSRSWNDAFPFIQNAFGEVAEGTGDVFSMLQGLLGAGGDPEAAEGGFRNFLDSTGYRTVFDEAMRGVTSSAAGRGLYKSGATLKALQDRAANLGQQSFTNYLGHLGNLGNMGLNAGQLVAGAGQRSEASGTSTSKQKPGLGSLIGGFLGGI